MKTQKLSAVLNWEDNMYVAWCPELDIASQGKTVENAVNNLREAVELYLEESKNKFVAKKEPILTTFEVKSYA